ncbi:uncharacterized protein LOC112686656 isoform X2 [Sipha flava]|uniref:Uncharacterized protein LOC112686656 isoform X2 n=1 Tax=Sipha flava TaxID=143950 RepID=A0A8B8FWV4_9HEMI|nr:uncharacterized protein LOC112686656 isoform X2 [Sipha flava]
MFKCVQCNRMFSSKDNLVRHNKIHKNVQFTCEICFKTFARKDNLAKHTKNMHANIVRRNEHEIASEIFVPDIPAGPLDEIFDSDYELCVLVMEGTENIGFCEGLENCKRGNSKDIGQIKRARLNLVGNATGFVNVGSSFNNIITWYYKKNLENIFNHSIFLSSIKSELIEILKSSSKPLKFNLKLEATYNKPHVDNSSVNRAFKTSARVHKVIEFNQSLWLAKYISLNTEMRKKAVNEENDGKHEKDNKNGTCI